MKTILVAEPHRPTLELLSQWLTQAGYRVLATDEPVKAFEQCVSERPDAVLIAVDLPRLQGVTLGKLIRGTDAGARLPLLAVDKGHLGKAKGVGAVLDLMVNAYLLDATNREELLGRLSQLLSAASQAPRPTTGIAAVLSRPPVASGDLKARALPAHVHSWYRLARDGILVVVHRDLTRRVFFLKGAPVNYESSARQDSLESWLLDRGTLSSEKHAEMLNVMRDGGLSAGAALVAVGAVEAGEPLLVLLKEWAKAKTAEVYAMSAGRFSFYAGGESAAEVPSLELPALGLIYNSARASWPMKAFAIALAPQMRLFPTRAPDFAKELHSLGLATADLRLALTVDGRRTLRELASGAKDLRHALGLLWYLTVVGALEYSDKPSEGGSAGFEIAERAAATGPRRKPLPEAKAHELREDAIRILTASYFRVLNLDITADGEAVERAYHQTATKFHSDSYSEFDLGPIEDLLASVQDKISAAYRVLADQEKRKAYVNYLLSRSEVVRAAGLNVDAEIALKRAENLMKKGDWRGALIGFEQAVSLNAREPEYYSFLAWATFKAGQGDAAQRARAANKLLKKALAMNPTLERPQVISAIIEDEIGDPAEARRTLLKVLKANPDCQLAKKALQGLSKRRGAGEK